jgi:asparagine N-glycosylation enzyme membrane subunit Stt3
MMAAAKAVAGHCAMFWVVPITGALLVWMTFALGRRLRSATLGLAGAWLVATSPAFLAMLTSPMSDVPAAAFWAFATYYALGNSSGEAIASGLAASAAILIRPNLAPLAVVVVAWKGLQTGLRPSRPSILLALGIVPGCLLVAWLNDRLYGSPLASGYGNLSYLSLLNVVINLRNTADG